MSCVKCNKPKQREWTFCPYCGLQTPQVLAEQSNAEEDGAVGGLEESTSRSPVWSDVNHKRNAGSDDEERPNVAAIHFIADQAVINSDLVSEDNDIELMTEENVKLLLDETKQGFGNVLRHFENIYNRWRSVTINIAFTGKSGCGKSTLINALRGLKSDDVGAAKVGNWETTMKPTKYVYPNSKNVILWDLPGIGTDTFKKKTYIVDVNFKMYDFIILVSDKRFETLDGFLAREIYDRFPKSNLVFVRTKLDNELSNIQGSKGTPMNFAEQKKLVDSIKADSVKRLENAGIKGPNVFMINSHNPKDFDFGKLVDMFIKTVCDIKRESFVLTNIILTTDALNAKIVVLNEHLNNVSQVAAVAAIQSNRDEQQYLEVEVLKSEIHEYQRHLGIDKAALEYIARELQRDFGTICNQLHSESDECLENFTKFYKNRDTVQPSIWYRLPIFGKKMKIWAYQRQCNKILKEVLRKCVNDANKLRRVIGKWSPI